MIKVLIFFVVFLNLQRESNYQIVIKTLSLLGLLDGLLGNLLLWGDLLGDFLGDLLDGLLGDNLLGWLGNFLWCSSCYRIKF